MLTDEPSPSSHGQSRAEQAIKLGELSLRSQRDRDAHTIHLTGEMDIANAQDVERELIRVEATSAATIIIDLAGLPHAPNGARRAP